MYCKKICSILVVISLIFSLAGCIKKDPETKKPTQEETASAAGQETEVESNDLSFLEPQSKLIVGWAGMSDAVKNGFIRENPDFEIDITDTLANPFGPDKSMDLQKLGAAIYSNEQPDFMELRMTATEAYYSNMYEPIDRYIKHDPNYNIEDIDENVLDATTFNGIVYFLPDNYTADILIWNKELFEQAGLDPETPPKTWDEYLEMCTKLVTTDSTGRLSSVGVIPLIGIWGAFAWERWHLAAFGQDAHYVDNSRLKFRWDTPEYLETFEFIRNLQELYGGSENLPKENFDFFTGNAGFINWSATHIPVMSMLTDFDYGFTTLPAHDKDSKGYIPGGIGCSYGIPKGAKNPAGGWKMVTYRLSDGYLEEAYDIIYSEAPGGFMPAYAFHKPTREKILDAFEDIIDEDLIEIMKQRDEIESSRDITHYTSPVEGELMTYFYEQAPKMMNYELSPKEFLKQLQQYSESLLDDFKNQKIAEGWIFEEGKDGIPPGQ